MAEDRLLRIWEVIGCKKRGIKGIIPCSKSTFYRHIQEGTFPSPKKISRISYWKMSDFSGFIDDL